MTDSAIHNTILAKLSALRSMNVADLRVMWLELYKTPVSKTSSCLYLRRRLAYRIQELAYGGNSEETENRLAKKAAELFGNGKVKHKAQGSSPTAGSILTRTYHGVEHQVAVLPEGGFQYNGCKYRSLSGIAKKITGMAWSGPLFFGLKQKSGGSND